MAVGSLVAAGIIFLHFQLSPRFSLPALAAIVFFNILFVCLLFPLEGPILRKTVLLLAGNTVGMLWYLIQALFENTFVVMNTDLFKAIMLVARPLVDFVWIVAVWSISLSVLASYKSKRLETI
jgi:hypothetical protein